MIARLRDLGFVLALAAAVSAIGWFFDRIRVTGQFRNLDIAIVIIVLCVAMFIPEMIEGGLRCCPPATVGSGIAHLIAPGRQLPEAA
jgi:hypothetical protein